MCSLLTSCYSGQNPQEDGPPRYYRDINNIPNARPRYLPKSPYGNPAYYQVNGETYRVLPTADGYKKRGIASWYGSKFTGKLTSTREHYDPYKMTAASPELPIPCFVRVTNLENGKSIIVKVNDRGPFAPNRIIDLSYAAASKLGYQRKGTAMVEVNAIDFDHPTNPSQYAQTLTHPGLYLQAGAFDQYQNAIHLQQALTALTDKKVFIYTSHTSGNATYLVQIGPLIGVGEADKLHTLIKNSGFGNSISIIR